MTTLAGPFIEVLGLVAATLTTFAFLPQALRIWRMGSAKDISLTMYLMMFTGSALWLVYGLMIGSFAITVANLAGMVLVGSVLALKIRDMMRPAPMPAPVTADRA